MGQMECAYSAYFRKALNAIKILVAKCARKRGFGIARHRLKDSIKTDAREIECEDFRNLPWTINPLTPACTHDMIVLTCR
jgi:hypothetical protein